jgi:drug/metabolite transporter (DMT)-like permease
VDTQIPNSLNWILAIISIVTFVWFLVEKLPKLLKYFRGGAAKDVAKSRNEYVVGSVLALLCAAIWAASYASLKLVSPSVGTLTTNIYLMGSAAVALYVGSVIAAKFRHSSPSEVKVRPGRKLAVLVVANLGNFVFSVWALRFISASEAMTLNNMSPLLLALALWFRGKLTPSLGTFLALVLVLLGAFILNTNSGFVFRTGESIRGSLIAVVAGASFALWTFTMDELKASFTSLAERMRILAQIFFMSYVILVTCGFFTVGAMQATTLDYTILILNGVRVAIVHVLYTFAVQRAGPLLASVVLVLMVPMTFPFDNIWNHATISAQLIIGATLIGLAAIGLLSDELRRARG